jgi:hypothetical protein
MYDRLDRLGEGQRAAIHDEAEQVADGIRGDARRRRRRAKSARLRRRRL